jgi:hypothetical protein
MIFMQLRGMQERKLLRPTNSESAHQMMMTPAWKEHNQPGKIKFYADARFSLV